MHAVLPVGTFLSLPEEIVHVAQDSNHNFAWQCTILREGFGCVELVVHVGLQSDWILKGSLEDVREVTAFDVAAKTCIMASLPAPVHRPNPSKEILGTELGKVPWYITFTLECQLAVDPLNASCAHDGGFLAFPPKCSGMAA